jgi:S-adenosylmethionine decarboxylase
MEHLGQHILLDLYGCDNTDHTWDQLNILFTHGLKEGNFTVLNSHHHQFLPHGLSGVFVLAESHLSFHIWEELKFVSLDIYWCGKKCDEQKLINIVNAYFNPSRIDFKYVERGFFE